MENTPELMKADAVIDGYAQALKQRLRDNIALYVRDNPGWQFSHLELKMNEEENADTVYRLQPKFVKTKP